MVRETNRAQSASKASGPISKSAPKSKKDIRDCYWNTVKDIVSMELKKSKVEMP